MPFRQDSIVTSSQRQSRAIHHSDLLYSDTAQTHVYTNFDHISHTDVLAMNAHAEVLASTSFSNNSTLSIADTTPPSLADSSCHPDRAQR